MFFVTSDSGGVPYLCGACWPGRSSEFYDVMARRDAQDRDRGRKVRRASTEAGAARRGKISSTTARILEVKQTAPHLTSGQIAQKVGVSASAVRKALARQK